MRIPDEGLCAMCEETIQLRRDGTCYVHPRPYVPDAPIVFTLNDARAVANTNCPASRQHPAVRLEMTFARWLHAHHRRRDACTNPLTYLAQRVFQPCAGTPARTPADVTWASPEELHLVLRGKSHNCDWLCGYMEQAAKEFEKCTAAAAA
ncbi:hypothetical protein [Kitasatospora sp. NPDC001175]|uniref:hypothetical protein n=1 Tax=Kitasatospora sp. NPDC001175 TaxID=3157103 RepID=UPI003CFE12FB